MHTQEEIAFFDYLIEPCTHIHVVA